MKKHLIVKQHDIRDCGACSLKSIISYYGGNIPISKIKMDTKTGKDGTTAFNIINAAKKYGFNGIGLKINRLEEISSLPVIAHITLDNGLNHFIVIYKYNNKDVYVMDPAKGYRKMNRKDFLTKWNNIILLFKPYQKPPYYKDKNYIRNYIVYLLGKEKKTIIKIIIISVFLTFLSLLLSFYLQIILSNNKMYFFLKIFTLFLILTIIKLFLNKKRIDLENDLNAQIDKDTIIPFISHIFNLPLDIIKSRTPGDILTKINELNNIKSLFSDVFVSIFIDGMLSICSMITLYILSRKLFLVLFLLMLLYVVISILFIPFINKKINDNIDCETEFNSKLIEQVSSIDTIKNLNIVSKSINNINDTYLAFLYDTYYFKKFLNIYNTLKLTIIEFTYFIINTYGFILINNNSINILTLITFNTIMLYFMRPIESLGELLPKISLIKISIEKINELLVLEEEKYGEDSLFSNGNIILKNISYSYNDYNNVLNNINLSINCNDRVLIYGPSGIGKSTLCQILNRTIENYKGEVLIDNINIKDYSIKCIRNNVRYVSQKEKLFTDSLVNNITLGEDYELDEINKVLKITRVDKILKNKEFRLNTLLLDSGSNLSGGERQRIILARSIINKPSILILDESLSEMDNSLEIEIMKDISDYLKDSTIIYISHKRIIEGFKIVNL